MEKRGRLGGEEKAPPSPPRPGHRCFTIPLLQVFSRSGPGPSPAPALHGDKVTMPPPRPHHTTWQDTEKTHSIVPRPQGLSWSAQAVTTKHHGLGRGLSNRHLSSPGLEAGPVSDEGSLHGAQTATFSLCPHVTGRDSELSGVSSHKDTNPTESGPHPYGLI